MEITDPIEVVPYDPAWQHDFATEAPHIKKALGSNGLEIHHIGSTSVVGLSAKPIVDFLVVVSDLALVDKVNETMEQMGYVAYGEYGIPFRRFFRKVETNKAYHIHVFEKNNPEIDRNIYFRDWMRSHKEDCLLYEKLKIELAKKFTHDRTAYCQGKADFIANINAKAGFNKLYVTHPSTDHEWEMVRHFRQTYFFDKVPVSDPYTWTFDHKDHIHFTLYQGKQIIGYAHIQLWADLRAALRIIVIEETYRHQGIGSYFMDFIERWLKSQGILKLHTQSSKDAYPFYEKRHYHRMPFNDPDGYESDPRDIEMGKILNS